MSDVRLTATNPEDSSVVPVACNAKGELLLEEPIAPPEFDGYLDGDLTVTGIGTFAGAASFSGGKTNIYSNGAVRVGDNPSADGAIGCDLNAVGNIRIRSSVSDALQIFPATGQVPSAFISSDGSVSFRTASFLESTTIEPYDYLTAENTSGQSSFIESGFIRLKVPIDHSDPDINAKYTSVYITDSNRNQTTIIYGNGAAVFKGDVTVGSRSKDWMLVEQGGLCHMVEQTRSTTDLIDQGFSAPEYPNLRDVFKELDLIEEALNTVMEKLRLTPPAGWEVWDGSDNSH